VMNAAGCIKFLTVTGVGIVKFDMPSARRLVIADNCGYGICVAILFEGQSCKDGILRHTYATELQHVPRNRGESPRHVDSIWALWNLYDYTPEGRGETHPKLHYAQGA
jgi:predicted dithiol-disulfide oxidoreductase (DUF899 family)